MHKQTALLHLKTLIIVSTVASFLALTSCGGDDLIVAKAVNEGVPSILWTGSVGQSNSGGYPEGILLGNDGSLYLTGSYTGKSGIEGLPEVSQGLNNSYVIKYNSTGTEDVIMDLGWQIYSGLSYIELDNTGQVYIAGLDIRNTNPFYMAIDLSGPTQLLTNTITVSSNSSNPAAGLALGPNNEVIIGGVFKNTISFANGDSYLGNIFGSAAVAKYNAQAEMEWSYFTSSDTRSDLIGLDTDAEGNTYCSTCWSGSLTLTKLNASGEEVWNKTDLGYCQGSKGLKVANNGIYVASNGKLRLFDEDGSVSWEAEAGTSTGLILGLDANYGGEVVIVGNYSATGKMGSIEIPAPENGFGSFIAKFNNDGSVQWVSTKHDATNVSINESGQVAFSLSSSDGVVVNTLAP